MTTIQTQTTTNNIIDFLLSPIIPIGTLGYYLCVNICTNQVVFVVLFLLFAIASYKVVHIVKIKFITFYHIAIVSVDWFLLDIVNLFSNNSFASLNPSILETVLKLGFTQLV